MLSCREVSELISEELDRDITFRERLGVRLHLMMCRGCSRFLKQIRFLRRVARSFRESAGDDQASPSLSPKARKRIQETLDRNES